MLHFAKIYILSPVFNPLFVLSRLYLAKISLQYSLLVLTRLYLAEISLQYPLLVLSRLSLAKISPLSID